MHEVKRETLPIADVEPAGVVTYDARDPDTAFPASEPLRPPRVRRMTGPVGAMTYVVAGRFIRDG